MHSSFLLFLGLSVCCSAQLADLTAPLEDNPSTALSITPTDNARIEIATTDDDGVGAADFGSNSPEALIISQTDDNQLCFFNNGNNKTPSKRRLRAREWCRNNQNELSPNSPPVTDPDSPATTYQEGESEEGSAPSSNLGGPSAEQNRMGKPRTKKPPELPSIPGRTSYKERDPDPCKGERTYAVCSPLEPTTVWFPLSLVWNPGSLEYCRLCTLFFSFYHLHSTKKNLEGEPSQNIF